LIPSSCINDVRMRAELRAIGGTPMDLVLEILQALALFAGIRRPLSKFWGRWRGSKGNIKHRRMTHGDD